MDGTDCNKIHLESTIGHLLETIKEFKDLAGRKKVIYNIQYYIGILSSINLKQVSNENYQLIYIILKYLLENKIDIEFIVLDKILIHLNLAYILKKDDNITLKYVNNILSLISKCENENVNSMALFNCFYESIIILVNAFADSKMYSNNQKTSYTLDGEDSQEDSQSEEEDDEETEEEDDEETEEDEVSDGVEDKTEDDVNGEMKGKRKRLTISHNDTESIEFSKEMTFSKKRKIENEKGYEKSESISHELYGIKKIYEYIIYVNNIFSIYLKNPKSLFNNVKLYAFYNNLFGLYSYVCDYMQYIKLKIMKMKYDNKQMCSHIINNLCILKNNIKKIIIINIGNIRHCYFRTRYMEFKKQKYKLNIDYNYFNFGENEKIFEIIYLIINKISNDKPCFFYDSQNKKLHCPPNLYKNKKDKIQFFFENDYELNQKYKFYNIAKIRGCIKILFSIIKYFITKVDTSHSSEIQNFLLLFILIPHFQLNMYTTKVAKTEYSKLFNIDKLNQNCEGSNTTSPAISPNKKNVNKNQQEEDDAILKNQLHKSNEIKQEDEYFENIKIKIPKSYYDFDNTIYYISDKETYSNIIIIIEYSKVIFKYLYYLNKKVETRKNAYLSYNLLYFVKHIFGCAVNSLMDANKIANIGALREINSQDANDKDNTNFSKNYEKIYIKGKPYVIFYNQKMKAIFSTCTSWINKYYKADKKKNDNNNTNDVVDKIFTLKLKEKNKIKNIIYINYLIYLCQTNLLNIIYINIKTHRVVFFSLFSFINQINITSKYSNMNKYNTIGGAITINKQRYIHDAVYHFNDCAIKNILNIYIKIFKLEDFFKFVYIYSGGHSNSKKAKLRLTHFLLNPIILNVIKNNINKLIDQSVDLFEYFIKIYESYINKFNNLLDKIVSLIKTSSITSNNTISQVHNSTQNINNAEGNDGESIKKYEWAYQSNFINIETMEYIICCYMKSINKGDINDIFLNFIEKMLILYLKKKNNIIIFYEQIRGKLIGKWIYNYEYSIYIYIFFLYNISRLTTFSLLNTKSKDSKKWQESEKLKKKLSAIISLLQNCFTNIEAIYDNSAKEANIRKFFDILHLVLETLFFYIHLAEFGLLDKKSLLGTLTMITNILKKNALENYKYIMKERICNHICCFFVYNYPYLYKIYGDDEDFEALYMNFIRILYIDINIIKTSYNYKTFIYFINIIQENKKLYELFAELFILHSILIIKNCNSTFNFNSIVDIEQNNINEAYYIYYASMLIKINEQFIHQNDWYGQFNLNKKMILAINKNLDITQNDSGKYKEYNSYSNFKNQIIKIFNNNMKNGTQMKVKMFYDLFKEKQTNKSIDHKSLIFSTGIFTAFNNIHGMEKNLYTLLSIILENYNYYNIYYEQLLINILNCFIKHFHTTISEEQIQLATPIFIKLSFYIFKIEKQRIIENKNNSIRNNNLLAIKLFFHIFFIFINALKAIQKEIKNNEEKVNKTDETSKIIVSYNSVNELNNEKNQTNMQKYTKMEAYYIFFIKYFILTYDKISKEDGENDSSNINDEDIYSLTESMFEYIYKGTTKENKMHRDASISRQNELIIKLKTFIITLLSDNRKETIKLNGFFLELIEFIFLSFIIDSATLENNCNVMFFKIFNMFKSFDIKELFCSVQPEYKTFVITVFTFILRISKNDEIKEKDDKNVANKKKTSAKKNVKNLFLNIPNLITFFKLLLSQNLNNTIYNFKDEENKKECIIIYDFLFSYNKILIECQEINSVCVCLKFNDMIKTIFNSINFAIDDTKNILEYIYQKINDLYTKEKDIKNFLYFSNIHIITLIFIYSNNQKFLLNDASIGKKTNNIMYFLNIYFSFIKYINQIFDCDQAVQSTQIYFLLCHLIYKLSQLFIFCFIKIKDYSKKSRYSSLYGFATNYCSLVIRTLDLLKKQILKIDDKKNDKLKNVFMTHFYIINNSHIFEKNKFYLYLISHQLYAIIYEFFNMRISEQMGNPHITIVEIVKKSGYTINFFCSYIDSVLYLDSRVSTLLLRNANNFSQLLKKNKEVIDLSKIAYPILIKIVEIYDIIVKKNTMSEEKYEERKSLKNIFQVIFSLLDESSIQLCYSSLNETKKKIFDFLSN
ncbi:conserved Plasmodium protein, unknown function [Plasmodium vinckei brucechwatti]|uniref:Uncharacterized protein n=1 Tax=Plasmodium vinckei brucechwatti TaxID=119398 RepID=A0A6V7S1Z4_PLAVN|nr:conserved Plasmodium protein, unknown function [Plasmodium vinckei brucechwatti]